MSEREKLVEKLVLHDRLLTTIDTRRKVEDDDGIGYGVEQAIVQESLDAVEIDTARVEAVEGTNKLVLCGDWYTRYFGGVR